MKILLSARNQAYSFDCPPDEPILYAGLRHGLELPYECATGTCGTCKARLIGGDVHDAWPEAPGRSYLRRGGGELLMCQSVARADCSLEVTNVVRPMPPGACLAFAVGAAVRGVAPLTHDVVSLRLDLDQPVDFEAGQFMVMRVPGIPGWRAYSMANFDLRARGVVFVVKKKPGGGVSEWLFGGDVEGTRVELFGPLGRATFHPHIARDLLCIAGGSGIAGMMAILARACRDRYFDRHAGRVFFGVRTQKDVFFLDELAAFKARHPDRLEVTVALSDEEVSPPLRAAHPELAFATGLVHAVAGEGMRDGFQNVRAYVAGPPPMVDAALRMLLLDARLTADNIRYDRFS